MPKERATGPHATRREFLQAGALGAGALVNGIAFGAPAAMRKKQPNFLFIITDQLGLDALSVHGCADAHTPNMDRLAKRGVTFIESHSTNPVCSPARSSMMTGRMPVETGVITNGRPIHPSRPNLGQWLGARGYEPVYCGKWHLPGGYPNDIPGFTVLPSGGGQGDLVDNVVSRSCEAYLHNRKRDKPFVLVASLLQPHDICYWAIKGKVTVPERLPFARLASTLPELPPNHKSRPKAPSKLASRMYKGFNDDQWRYYLYVYNRQVEMADADIGRIMDALESSGQAEDTIVMLTSDHGDGRARHMHTSKWYPYDEAMKVPMVVAGPGRVAEGVKDTAHLVSGLDVLATMCDYAGVEAPPGAHARSLRPLLEGKPTEWRECLVSEVQVVGRTVRTDRFKYVHYEGDAVEQLFDMKADPWETRNLYEDARHASVLADHRKLLQEWNRKLEPVEPTPSLEGRWRKRRAKKS